MLESILIGLLFIALYAVILSIVVYGIIYLCGAFGFPLPDPIPKLLWAAVLIIILIMVVSLLLGWSPRFRVGQPDAAPIGTSVAAIAPA